VILISNLRQVAAKPDNYVYIQLESRIQHIINGSWTTWESRFKPCSRPRVHCTIV